MSCRRIQQLLPLYAGHDLDAGDEATVVAHLRGCAACSGLADGFLRSRQLLHRLEPAPFDETTYAEIRSRVLTKISSEPVASPFLPRLAWGLAAVLLVAVLLGSRLIGHREEPRPIAAKLPEVITPLPPTLAAPPERPLVVAERREPPRAPKRRRPTAPPVRVEIQTSDPNIRIIWFTQGT